jgi:hypothetical protein
MGSGTTRGGRRRHPMVAPREQPFPRRSWRRSMTSQPQALREGYRKYVEDRRRERLLLPQCANVRWTRSGSGGKRKRICGRRTVQNESENGAPIGARDVGGTPLGTASVLTMCPEEEHRRSSPHRPSISASARRDRSGTLRHLSRRRGQIRRTATLVTNVMRGGMKSARREGPKSSPSTCTCRQRTHSERPRTSRPNEDEQLLQVRPAQR